MWLLDLRLIFAAAFFNEGIISLSRPYIDEAAARGLRDF